MPVTYYTEQFIPPAETVSLRIRKTDYVLIGIVWQIYQNARLDIQIFSDEFFRFVFYFCVCGVGGGGRGGGGQS